MPQKLNSWSKKPFLTFESMQNQNLFLLCDTNSLDAKVGVREEVWNSCLNKNKISIDELKKNYDIVFHVQDVRGKSQRVDSENQEISQNWSTHQHYYQINYDPEIILKGNVDDAVKKIRQVLKQALGMELK